MTDILPISAIIPCIDEEENLMELLPYLQQHADGMVMEIIVVDAGSQDDTIAIANSYGAITVNSPVRNRAFQMNLGAQQAKADILYFVHADTRPPMDYAKVILSNVSQGKHPGCFQYKFQSSKRILKINSWFTRFNGLFSGGGDQSLYISKLLFESLGGFDASFCIMEDFELVKRIRQKTDFHVLPYKMSVSARKYTENSWLKVQLANLMAFSLFLLKVKPASIKSLYLNLLNQKK
ncbi:TIGR04283 family arsenosugar biosynthesis glycosyltransferase [Algoriphagus sp. AGSA1]|uniref:TIGR04283 family arsenosugar biosynthesis glycosyltransferase n=1 Tax=Algoriphagus sp. AGSA1 TaxID=2907213 RepID=UPI0021D4708E|nr:TIGR04283 family arsenosugar biosynthesis glycosyltransferase [Algoriphagus sp. AGSA1]MCE7056720.1 TIGR04283 family arsenosugar biosynthesis glycosyltransferase [Algoriphagus sp. AGSA1]